jgi:hypothetical protein
MIETVQIPILLKAIDFLFEEGRKILEERRERRKKSAEAPQTAEKDREPDPALPAPEVEIIPLPDPQPEVKQDLLTSTIDELLWKNHEAEVGHLVRLLETHSKNYHIAREQYAKWGSALVPPIIVHNMTEAENSMLETLQRLEAVLSKVYQKEIRPVG